MKTETQEELAQLLKDAEARMAKAEDEVARARADQEKAAMEAKLLRGVLEIHGVGTSPASGNLEAASTPVTPGFQQPVKFREAIRGVVEGAPKPVSIAEVTDHLKSIGFSEEGTTPLPVRVGNELYKLTNLGEIKRASRGHYESK